MSFAATAVVGIVVGNPTVTILWRATLVMVAAWVVGRVIGGIAQHTIDDYLNRYKRHHPISGNDSAMSQRDQSTPS